MQRDEFNDILKQHASGFELKPASASFNKVMERRKSVRRQKRVLLWGIAASILAVAGLVLVVPTVSLKESPVAMQEQAAPKPSSQTEDRSVKTNRDQDASPLAEEKIISGDNTVAAAVEGEDKSKQKQQQRLSADKIKLADASRQVQPVTSQEPKPFAQENQQHKKTHKQASQKPVAESTLAPLTPITIDAVAEPTIVPIAAGTKKSAEATMADQPVTAKTERSTGENETHSQSVLAGVNITDSLTTLKPVVTVPDSLMPPVEPTVTHTAPYNWSIVAIFTPQLFSSVYNANSDATLSWMKQYLENREQNDRAQYSFNTGLKAERRLSKHFSVSAGVLYSIVKFEEIRLVNTVIKDTAKPSVTLAEADQNKMIREVNRNSFDISFHSLEVPIQVYYTIGHKSMFYQAGAGVGYSYLFKTRSLVFDTDDSLNVQETDDAKNDRLRQHNLLVMGGLNVGCRLNKRWSVYLGPVFRYSLNSIYSKDYIIRQQPYYIGVETGVKFSL